MSNRAQIESRAVRAAEQALSDHQYVSAIDVLVNMGLLQPVHVQEWRKGKVLFLEKVIQGSLGKISYAMECFRHWAREKCAAPQKLDTGIRN